MDPKSSKKPSGNSWSKKQSSNSNPLSLINIGSSSSSTICFPLPSESHASAGAWPSNSAMWPNNLSFLENVVPHVHFHLASPPQCFKWLLKSESTEKCFLRHRSHVYIFGQWLRLKWFFTQITDFSGRNRRWSLFRLQPTNGHENRVARSHEAFSEGFASASAVLNCSPCARMCMRRFASRRKPFPQISQKCMCSARISTASSSTISLSSPSRGSSLESSVCFALSATEGSGFGFFGYGGGSGAPAAMEFWE